MRSSRLAIPFLFLAPAIAVLGSFILFAAIQVVYLSFTRYNAFTGPDWIGLENYSRVFASERFWRCLANSFLYLIATPIIIVLSLLAAMAVEANLRAGHWLRALLFLPVITPTIVAAFGWRIVLAEDEGLLNAAMRSMGFEGIRWLTQYPWTLFSAMLVTLWKGFGFYMMIFLAALTAVPRELKEAAALDGANRFQVFRAVTFPAIAPAIGLVGVVSSISALKVFDEIFVTIRGTSITHQTVVPLIYRVAFEEGNFGLASALGLVLFVIILVFSIINLRMSRGGAA
jgi:putative chitobiose transport system permease protein